MPKRKGGRKKRGGSKQNPLANSGNVHNSKNFGSDQGLISGCAGCVGGNVAIGSGCSLSSPGAAQESATRGIGRLMNGIVGRVGGIQTGGGNVAITTFKNLQNAADEGLGYGRAPVTSVSNCGVTSSTSMGAGQRQKGGGVSQTASCVAGCNNLGPAGYGLNVKGTSDLNAALMGSGYPAVSPYNANKCGGRKTRKHRKHKKRRTKRKRKKKRRTRKRRGTRRKRGGGVSTWKKITQTWQKNIGFPPQLRGGKRGKKGGTRKKMRGGYAQFASNDPNTPGFSSPKSGPLPWATGPLSKSRQINCQDNYDHFTGKSSASPVLDQAAPVTPFGGTA
jgi:hypothetical protein